MRIKTAQDISRLIELGKRYSEILHIVSCAVKPGVSTIELEILTEKLIREKGDVPAFKNYRPEGAMRPYPCALCVAPNNVVVHGIPTEQQYVLKDGDIIGLDIGIIRDGYVIDAGKTVPVGTISLRAQKLLNATYESLMCGVEEARMGKHVGDIGNAIESYARKSGYGIVRELCGHGVGHALHEEPQILNYGARGKGELLKEGMVLAIEPMLNEGNGAVIFSDDGYTVYTKDGSLSAHFEHNVVITKGEPLILTQLK